LAWSIESDGSVEFVNRRWCNYTGLTTEQARGSGWLSVVHPEDIGWMSEQRRVAITSGKPFELESPMRRHDGQYRWFINRADPLLDEQGEIVKWYGTNTDIDDRKRAEEALRRAQADFAHMTRLTIMGELTASIAHEVNQPLTAVVTFGNAALRWLAADLPNLDEAREAVRHVVRNATRASEVARRGASLHTELAANLPAVAGDRVQLQQVLLNLIINACDAMSALIDRPRVVCIRTHEAEPKSVLVAVEDSGVGLNREQAARLSRHSTRRSPKAWAWDYPSAARSSRRTAAGCGRRRMKVLARRFSLHCRSRKERQRYPDKLEDGGESRTV
jgi:PAS domain S-box-containing protein